METPQKPSVFGLDEIFASDTLNSSRLEQIRVTPPQSPTQASP